LHEGRDPLAAFRGDRLRGNRLALQLQMGIELRERLGHQPFRLAERPGSTPAKVPRQSGGFRLELRVLHHQIVAAASSARAIFRLIVLPLFGRLSVRKSTPPPVSMMRLRSSSGLDSAIASILGA
jgi:hypothetical protein